METPRTSERPALDTAADALRAWVVRNYGLSSVAVSVKVRLPNGDLVDQPLPQSPIHLYAAPCYQPSPGEGPPERDRNVSDECFDDIASILVERGERMTTEQILKGLDHSGHGWNETAVKRTLAHFKRNGQLTNDIKSKPPGYGLPEWEK